MLASASIGDGTGVYEPIHGSAHDITGMGLANPMASVLSVALLLDISFGMKAESEVVINAVDQVLKKGFRTGDIADASTDKSMILGTNAIGEEILKCRRVNSMFAPTPHDVLDKYIEVYGEKSLFPVVKTSIGNLACIASEEILYPEIARCLAFNGAEVFLHNTSEIASNLSSQKNIAKLARAIENMAYVVSANSASIVGYSIPAASTDAHSQIINYEGIKLCETLCGESMVANATIHIDALRHHRNRPGMSNFLSRQRLELFAPFYAQSIYPANSLINKDANRNHFIEQQRKTITLLKNKGIVE
jgi:hypothetical protein